MRRVVKRYCEIIADSLKKACRSLGRVSAVDSEHSIWITDAHRDEGQRFVVRSDEKLNAFVELESAIRSNNGHDRAAVPV
jgi:hypothetical protein